MFPNDPVGLGMRYVLERGRAKRELAVELRAQFERFAATGLKLSTSMGISTCTCTRWCSE